MPSSQPFPSPSRLSDPVKIGVAFAAGIVIAAVGVVLFTGDNAVDSAQRDAAADCAQQTWPYVDQKCADELKRKAASAEKPPLREVRVISTDQTAPAKVVLAPAPEPEAAKPESSPPETPVQASAVVAAGPATESAVPATVPALPVVDIAATSGVATDKDAFNTAAISPTLLTPPVVVSDEAAAATPTPVKEGRTKAAIRSALVSKAAAATPAKKVARREKRIAPNQSELATNYVGKPNEVVQERITTLADGRTVTMRRIYRNVRPDAAYEAARRQREAAQLYD